MAAAASSLKSDLKWRVTEIAKCPICLDDCKNPKSLPCLHSFCLHCLQQHWKDECPGKEVFCPVCRKVLKIPEKGLDELPLNFFLQNLIEARKASDEQPRVMLCEACEKHGSETEGDIPPATMYCVDCNQKLCERCSRAHKAMKGGPHQVTELGAKLSVQLIQQRGSYCEQHAGKLLEMYCFDCDTNICMTCYAVKHAKHQCLEVEKVAKDFAQSSIHDEQQVSARISKYETAMTQTGEGENKLMGTVQGVKTSVKERGEALKRTVDRQVENLIRELENFEIRNKKELADRKEGLELRITAMKSFTAYSRELMSKGSHCDITRGASELHARADELLMTYVTPTDYCAPGVLFVPMNIDELTEPRGGDQNLIGRISTTPNVNSCQLQHVYDVGRHVVAGVTRLGDDVLIVCNQLPSILRFSAITYQRLTEVNVSNLKNPYDIAACERTSQVYVTDYSLLSTAARVWRVLPEPKRLLPKTSDIDKQVKLSVTLTRLLVTSGKRLIQFDTDGEEIRCIQLRDDFDASHAVESPAGTFIVSHTDRHLKNMRLVSEVNTKGEVLNHISVSSRQPLGYSYLAADSQGNILVADHDNGRILLLNAELVQHTVIIDEHRLNKQPRCLCYMERLGQLLVGGASNVAVFNYIIG